MESRLRLQVRAHARVSIFVDTSVWSLALRRSPRSEAPEVQFLSEYLTRGELVLTTGLVLQELLQGFQGPKARDAIVQRFSLLPVVSPEIQDHVSAADLRNRCRRKGVQIGTIDALIASLCIRHELSLLTTDQDFEHVSRHCPLSILVSPKSRTLRSRPDLYRFPDARVWSAPSVCWGSTREPYFFWRAPTGFT